MAQIVGDFGGEVLMLEAKERILAEIEEEIAKHLTDVLKGEFPIVTGAKIGEITGQPDSMRIKYSDAAGNPGEFLCDYVLMATGKRPNTAKLNLEAAGVELAGAAIKTDAQCRTSVPHIFAVGDVIGGYMLAHTAAAQGRVAAHTLLGHAAEYDQDLDCGVTFSRPQAGFVGLSVAQAKARGIDAVEAKMPMSIDAKAMIAMETHGLIKLVADKARRPHHRRPLPRRPHRHPHRRGGDDGGRRHDPDPGGRGHLPPPHPDRDVRGPGAAAAGQVAADQ
jgi:dihydrolipoamide dehydrogenase